MPLTLSPMYALRVVASGVTLEIRLQGLRGKPFWGFPRNHTNGVRWNEAPKEEAPKEGEAGEGEAEEEKPKKKSGYYVLKCPKCGAKIRATKYTIHLMCMGDGDKMHEPTVMGIER